MGKMSKSNLLKLGFTQPQRVSDQILEFTFLFLLYSKDEKLEPERYL